MSLAIYEPISPSSRDTKVARDAYTQLSGRMLQEDFAYGAALGNPMKILVTDAEQQKPVELPLGAVPLLLKILETMAEGNGMMVAPVGAELTTSEAAEILNVSRPYVVKLIEDGKIPHHMVGSHRRLKLEDVVEYKTATRKRSEEVLGKLVEEGRKLGMGY